MSTSGRCHEKTSFINRLKPIMEDIISPYQNAFVSNRIIQDNITVGDEIMNTIRKKRKGGGIMGDLKLDRLS